MSGNGYSYKGHGTNNQVHPFLPTPQPPIPTNPHPFPQGNHYCARDYGSSASNSNTYHYSNT